jgi:hypothetical protein
VRNRVALKVARTRAAVTSKLVRVSVILALVPVVLVAGGGLAAAEATDDVAAESVSYGLAGPVGIAAVVVGFGGLILGLLRHRRREALALRRAVERAVERTGEQRAI